jgi:hypothetical protein
VTFLRRWVLASAGFLLLELASRPPRRPEPEPTPLRVDLDLWGPVRPLCLCDLCQLSRTGEPKTA